MLRISLSDSALDLYFSGATALLVCRRRLRIPRERIHRAFVLQRSFAVAASSRIPRPGWAGRHARIGVFGFGDAAQLWSAGHSSAVLAIYLRGTPYHRIVCEAPDPAAEAALINRWLSCSAAA